MARHRSPEPRPARDYLPLVAATAAAIAIAGLVTVMALDSNAQTAVPAPTPVVVITTPAAPPPTTGPRSTEQVWASCQAKATNAEHPGEAATECMIDYGLNEFMTCVTSKKLCSTTTPPRGHGMGPDGATASCTDGVLIYDPNPRTIHACDAHGGFAKVFD